MCVVDQSGVLANQCPHNLDLMQWLFGMPAKVRAHAHFGKWHHIETEDAVTAYLEFPNGATGVFVTTTGEAPGTNRLEIAAERGRIVVENGKIQYPVKGATIVGNGPDALTRVKLIGNDMALDPGVGTCGKEGQSVPVGVGQPTLRIDGLTVGGTG